jgi:hypothetical protein
LPPTNVVGDLQCRFNVMIQHNVNHYRCALAYPVYTFARRII